MNTSSRFLTLIATLALAAAPAAYALHIPGGNSTGDVPTHTAI